ncbi:zinc metalloprotease [Rapidithrix thailandica]|uniref:Zinc metalloprotease n=2 Tax=Rapidithrix thailandica TaxID=413964 RepID=A0AAW9S387_9BACT
MSCNDPSEELDIIEEDEIIVIPVVVHVLRYTPAPIDVSDEKIHSQIAVLNQDFRKKNPDHVNTPEEFKHLVADVGIEFRLATTDPKGKPTTGILRSEGEITGWEGFKENENTAVEDLKLFFTEKGGQDAWPPDKYLNIWVADLSNRHGNLGLPGYASFPGGDPRTDGVIIDPRAFGTLPPLNESHQRGRTATHEIGHWLNLLHIFGKNNDCEAGDFVEDTPSAYSQYNGSPVHPQSSCGSHDLFMNFMDYVDDQAMYMFTKGQKERMRAVFTPSGPRRALYEHISK